MPNDSGHRKYYHDGKEIPSCTTIVKLLDKPDIVKWANNMGFRRINTTIYIEDKAIIGTAHHELFEKYFMGVSLSANGHTDVLSKREYRELIYKFRVLEIWFEQHEIEVLNMELPMEGSSYGGTLDMIAYDRKNDELIVFDLKSSKYVRQSHWIQLMGYVGLVEEIYGLPVSKVGVILSSQKQLDSINMVTMRTTDDCWRERGIFNKLRDIYYYLNGTEEDVLLLE
jgi:hypothetical protein